MGRWIGGWLVAVAAGSMLVTGEMASAGPYAVTSRVSVSSAGQQANGSSHQAAVSADGRYIAFTSEASNLVAGDTNRQADVFWRDRVTGTTTRVSVGPGGRQANGDSHRAAVSADGRYVAFESYATNLVDGDTNNNSDVFVHDLTAGTTTRISVGSAGQQAHGASYEPAVSADGRYIAFSSFAPNLVIGDTNGSGDVFVHDLAAGTTTRISVSSAGQQGNDHSLGSAVSASGRYIAFTSSASNLTAGDTNNQWDVFVRDLAAGTTARVSVSSAGRQANGYNASVAISGSGRYIVFDSFASNLVAGDTNGAGDVFVHDLAAGTTTRASVGSAGEQGNDWSLGSAVSASGRYVAFTSRASNLVVGDTNGKRDVFVRDLAAGTTRRISLSSADKQANKDSAGAAVSATGRCIAFASNASNLVAGDTNGVRDVYVRDLPET
jgi:WD40-like Beta Propeller Repeat